MPSQNVPGAKVVPYFSFIVLCIAWGGTWLAIRLGVADVPPLWFAGTRFVIAGVILVFLARWIGGWHKISWPDIGRIVLMSVAAISVCFGLIFWGEQYVDSSVAGVLVQGLVPIGLFFFAATMGHEIIRRRQWLSLGVGIVGIYLLLLGQARLANSTNAILGIVAIMAGTIAYDWAGVYGRPIFQRYPAPFVSALENLFGGIILIPVSLAVEGTQIYQHAVPSGGALMSWIYLVLVGSVLGFTAYTYLLASWGPVRTSMYAFVTPILAVLLGATLGGEQLSWQQLLGTVLILVAVGFVLVKRQERTPGPADTKINMTTSHGLDDDADRERATERTTAVPPADRSG